MGFKRKPKRNVPGEPITDRSTGAVFYCVACFKTYQQCQCPVYMSADTLSVPTRNAPHSGAGKGH